MKTFELLEDTGGKLLSGGIKHWQEKLGVTKEDIKKAMALARELPSYKKLIKYMPENTTDRQKSYGTISFDGSIKGSASFNKAYVHFYGQVRSGNADLSRNAPLVSKQPEIFPGDPVKTVLTAYDNGFKTIMKSVNGQRMRHAPRLVVADIAKILKDGGISGVKISPVAKDEFDYSDPNWWRQTSGGRAKIRRGKHGFIIIAMNVYKTHDALYSTAQKPEEFLASITDDPEQQAKLFARLKQKTKAQKLAELSQDDTKIDEVAKILRAQKEFNLDVKVMKMTDARDEFQINKKWPDEFTNSFNVVYARLKSDDLRRYRYAELDDI